MVNETHFNLTSGFPVFLHFLPTTKGVRYEDTNSDECKLKLCAKGCTNYALPTRHSLDWDDAFFLQLPEYSQKGILEFMFTILCSL